MHRNTFASHVTELEDCFHNCGEKLSIALTVHFSSREQQLAVMNNSTLMPAQARRQEAAVIKIVGLGTANGGREREITIKRQSERVGVSRRRREGRFLSLKDVWRNLRCVSGVLVATQSRAQRQKVTGVGRGKNPHSSAYSIHTNTFKYTHSSSQHN